MRRIRSFSSGIGAVVICVAAMAAGSAALAPARGAAAPLDGARLLVEAQGQIQEYRLVRVDESPAASPAADRGEIAVFPADPLRMAPAAVHVHALDVPLEGDPLEAVYSWEFGNPAGRYNTLSGWSAAHVYDLPGEYTITLRISEANGRQHVRTTQVFVSADVRPVVYVSADGDDSNTGLHPASPWRMLGRAQQAMSDARGGLKVLLRRGDVFDVQADFVITASNLLIGAYGEGEPPVLLARGRTTTFMTRPGAASLVIQDLAFDSQVENDPGHGRIGSTAIRPAGPNLLVRNCTFLRLDDAMNSNARPRGVLMMDNTAPRIDGLRGYLAWAEGSDHVYIGNRAVNSTDEHILRADARGVERLLISHNDFARQAKTKTTIRLAMAQHAWLADNVLRTGPMEVGGVPDPNQEQGQRAETVVIRGNRFERAVLEVRHGAHDVLVAQNRFEPGNYPAISIHASDRRWPHRSLRDLRIIDNVAVNATAEGSFLDLRGRSAGAITLVGNRYVAPRLVPGGRGEPAVVRVFDEDLGSFARIAGNTWPRVTPARWADGPFFVAPAHGQGGYHPLEWWLAQPQISDERVLELSLEEAEQVP